MPLVWHPTAIVLHERRSVVHIVHKAASMSIIQAVMKMEGLPLTGPWHGNPGLTWTMSEETERDLPDYLHAVFVRNPFDRLASCYRYHILRNKAGAQNFQALNFQSGMPFADFVRQVSQDPGADVHFKPQAWQVTRPNFIGHVETIKADWTRLQQRLPLPDLQHKNQTGASANLYDSETKALANRIYGCDCDAFGYERLS